MMAKFRDNSFYRIEDSPKRNWRQQIRITNATYILHLANRSKDEPNKRLFFQVKTTFYLVFDRWLSRIVLMCQLASMRALL